MVTANAQLEAITGFQHTTRREKVLFGQFAIINPLVSAKKAGLDLIDRRVIPLLSCRIEFVRQLTHRMLVKLMSIHFPPYISHARKEFFWFRQKHEPTPCSD